MKTFETYNPLFTGFYNTIYEINSDDIDNEVEYFCDKHDLNIDIVNSLINKRYDDCIVENWNAYKDYVGDKSCGIFKDFLKEKGFNCDVVFESVSSPREYNFTNDSVNCKIIVDDDFINKIKEFIMNHKNLFAEYIKNNYTSYDGFMSYYSNDSQDWINNINDDISEHELGSILYFILLVNEDNSELMECYKLIEKYDMILYDDIYKGTYISIADILFDNIELLKKKSNELNDLKKMGDEYIDIMKTQRPEKNYYIIVKDNMKKLFDEIVNETVNELFLIKGN